MTKRTPLADRFWAKVKTGEPTDCWPWTGATRGGYGAIGNGHGGLIATHRLALALHEGRPVSSEEKVLHTCDNPPCCNAAHLFRGTQSDNMADMATKGRQRGPKLKLTDAQVSRIRSRHPSLPGITGRDAGLRSTSREYGVSVSAIRQIVSGEIRRSTPNVRN